MADEMRKGAGIEPLLAVWHRRKWLATITFVLPLTAALSLVFAMPSLYQSTATVLVDRQQVPEEFVRSTVTSALETRLHTISQEILSRSRLEGLITRFGLYRHLRSGLPQEELIEQMRKDIKLELKGVDQRRGQQSATIAFAISYRGASPQTVAQVTNTLASFYIEENLKVRERQATGTAQFLKVQLDETKKRLDEQERKVSEFKKRHLGELPQQMQANLATLEQLNGQLRLNSVSQIRVQEKRDLLAMQLPEAGLVGAPGDGKGSIGLVPPDPMTARLSRLKQELAELRTRFSDKYPDVIRLKAEIQSVEQELAARPEGAGQPDAKDPKATETAALTPHALRLRQALGEVDAELKVLKDEEKRIRGAIATYEQRVANVPKREQEYLEIARDYETTQGLYTSLLKRYEEAQIAESMEQRQKGEQFRILDPAVPSAEPAAPKRLQLLLMSLALSVGLAAGAVLLAEQVDTSFHTLDDLRAFTSVPVLAAIPRIVTGADLRRRRRRARVATASVALALLVVAGSAWFVARGNEQLVWLVTRTRS